VGRERGGVTVDKLRGDGYGRAGHDHHEEGIFYIYIYTQYTHTLTVCIGKCAGIKLADPRGL